jgi:hypothetical protein
MSLFILTIILSLSFCIIAGYAAYDYKRNLDELKRLEELEKLRLKRLKKIKKIKKQKKNVYIEPVDTGSWRQPVALGRTKEEADKLLVIETDTGQEIYVEKKKMVVEKNITDKSVAIDKTIVQPLNQSSVGTLGDKPCKRYPRTSDNQSPPDDGDYTYGECPLPDGTSCCSDKDKRVYGCTDEDSMWVREGCRGLFIYKGRMGYCGSMQDLNIECDNLYGKPCVFTRETCPVDKFKKLSDGNIAGLVDPKENLVLVAGNKTWEKMDKDDPCSKPGAWGMDDYDRPTEMWTKDGCRGYFKLGTTEGFCRNFCWSDDECEKQYCPIGTTKEEPFYKAPDVYERDEFGDTVLDDNGNPKYKQWREVKSGLRKTRARRRSNVHGAVTGNTEATWKNDNCDWEISPDGKKIHPVQCGGKFSWGYLKGDCNLEEKQEGNCLINWDGNEQVGVENDGQLILDDLWKRRL